MGATALRVCLVTCSCVALAACGHPRDEAARERAARRPAPAPRVVLTGDDRGLWAPAAADRSAIPVLRYGAAIDPDSFARQMTLLAHAGYETITLAELVRFVDGKRVPLPPRPLLLTFDASRLDAWTASDGILRELHFNAVMFVDVGPVEEQDPASLSWRELEGMERSGRWDVQLQSGTGHRRIQYGPRPGDVGAFYAYRGSEEVLGGWRERVFSDISYGEEQVAYHVRGYRPLAFAPPHGNYGQAGTNDPRIPRELLARLLDSFRLVFTQDRSGFARPGAANPLGRIDVTRGVSDRELHALLTGGG